MKTFRILVLPGDGIGPEVINSAVRVLNATAPLYGVHFDYREVLVGGAALEATGTPLPDLTIESCRLSDAVLMGPVGGPRWEQRPRQLRPEYAILGLRKALGLYLNLRPCRVLKPLRHLSPLRADLTQEIDCLLLRDLTGVNTYTRKSRSMEANLDSPDAYDVLYYTREQLVTLAQVACQIAKTRRSHIVSVDKANVLASSRIWRDVFKDVCAMDPQIKLESLYADSLIGQLLSHPDRFDVIVSDNLFGDFLSEQLAAILGSPAMAASASVGQPRTPGLFSAIHGTADDLVGRNQCNPLGAIYSAAMMMRWGLGLPVLGETIERAIVETIEAGYRTPDLLADQDDPQTFQVVGTREMTAAVIEHLKPLGTYHASSRLSG